MPPPLLETRMIKSILHHRLCLGHSLQHCAQALGLSKGVVAKYAALAQAAGLDCRTLESLDETQLQQRLHSPRRAEQTLALADGSRAHLFVAALGASHYTYAQALPGQKTADWIAGMTGALHFIGGVPELIVPDNQRAVIAQPDRYEPHVGDTVLDFAQHYGCSVLPARPRTPQDKAVVESAVQVVERWILARLRLRTARCPSAQAACSAPLRVRPLQARAGACGLPRRARAPPLQRAASAWMPPACWLCRCTPAITAPCATSWPMDATACPA